MRPAFMDVIPGCDAEGDLVHTRKQAAAFLLNLILFLTQSNTTGGAVFHACRAGQQEEFALLRCQ
jgi:hypothetical protein